MLIKPKKSLGQNFLIDKNIIEKITSEINLEDKNLLEIGPGTGNLTTSLLKKRPNEIVVVEKDANLCSLLSKKFNQQIKIINNDVLRFDPYNQKNKKIIVFGNLPYNISTEILVNWILNLKSEPWFTNLFLMFQKEVADRIIAKENTSKFGRLTIISKWRLDVKKLFDISPSCFYPVPKIYSSVLHFTLKKNYTKFKKNRNIEIVTKTFFNQRRKMIKKPMKQLFHGYTELAQELNIDMNLRPQNISLDNYYKIIQKFEELRD